MPSKKNFFFFALIYKMVDIRKKTYESNGKEVIVDGIGTLWLNEMPIEEKLDHKNLQVITNKYDPVYKNRRYELDQKSKQTENFYVVFSIKSNDGL